MKNLKTIIAVLICSTIASVALAGNITGTVTYEGDVPARKALTINTEEQHCITATKGAKSETLVVSKGKGIQNVVISVRLRGSQELKMPEKAPVVDQKDCRYLPHLPILLHIMCTHMQHKMKLQISRFQKKVMSTNIRSPKQKRSS